MWSAIKTILTNKNSKCLIIEDGKPKYVLLGFEEYQQLHNNKRYGTVVDEDKINSEMQELGPESLGDEIQPQQDLDRNVSTIRIEDLPF